MMVLNEFEKHLEACPQCREHPFDLCQEGSCLLRGAAQGVPPISDSREKFGQEVYEAFGKIVREHLDASSKLRSQIPEAPNEEHAAYLRGIEAAWMTAWYQLQHILFGTVKSVTLVEPLKR